MSAWVCGDCGTGWPESVDLCPNDALDQISLAGYAEGAPIYAGLVTETNVNPISDDHYRSRMFNHPVLRRRYGEEAS